MNIYIGKDTANTAELNVFMTIKETSFELYRSISELIRSLTPIMKLILFIIDIILIHRISKKQQLMQSNEHQKKFKKLHRTQFILIIIDTIFLFMIFWHQLLITTQIYKLSETPDNLYVYYTIFLFLMFIIELVFAVLLGKRHQLSLKTNKRIIIAHTIMIFFSSMLLTMSMLGYQSFGQFT